MSTLAVLAVLGAAIGFSAADYRDSPRAFGVGAGIWTLVSAIIAFFVGGALSAYTAATPATWVESDGDFHKDNSLLQGSMVWAVAIPLSIYIIAGGIGSVLGVAGRTANAAAQATSNVAGGAADQVNRQDVLATTQRAADDLTQAASNARDQVRNAVTPENVDKATDVAAGTAWGTLASMLIGLGAAALGGFAGGKARSTAATRR